MLFKKRKKENQTLETFVDQLALAIATASRGGQRADEETAIALGIAGLRSKDEVSKDLAIAGLLRLFLEEIGCREVLHGFLARYGKELTMCEEIEVNEVVSHLRQFFVNGFQYLTADAYLNRMHADLKTGLVLKPFYPPSDEK